MLQYNKELEKKPSKENVLFVKSPLFSPQPPLNPTGIFPLFALFHKGRKTRIGRTPTGTNSLLFKYRGEIKKINKIRYNINQTANMKNEQKVKTLNSIKSDGNMNTISSTNTFNNSKKENSLTSSTGLTNTHHGSIIGSERNNGTLTSMRSETFHTIEENKLSESCRKKATSSITDQHQPPSKQKQKYLFPQSSTTTLKKVQKKDNKHNINININCFNKKNTQQLMNVVSTPNLTNLQLNQNSIQKQINSINLNKNFDPTYSNSKSEKEYQTFIRILKKKGDEVKSLTLTKDHMLDKLTNFSTKFQDLTQKIHYYDYRISLLNHNLLQNQKQISEINKGTCRKYKVFDKLRTEFAENSPQVLYNNFQPRSTTAVENKKFVFSSEVEDEYKLIRSNQGKSSVKRKDFSHSSLQSASEANSGSSVCKKNKGRVKTGSFINDSCKKASHQNKNKKNKTRLNPSEGSSEMKTSSSSATHLNFFKESCAQKPSSKVVELNVTLREVLAYNKNPSSLIHPQTTKANTRNTINFPPNCKHRFSPQPFRTSHSAKTGSQVQNSLDFLKIQIRTVLEQCARNQHELKRRQNQLKIKILELKNEL
jgi:hypothetical protein